MESSKPPFWESLHSRLTDELGTIAKTESYVLKIAEKSVRIVKKSLEELRNYVFQYPFKDEAEEIYFFKEVKPRFYSKLLYFTKSYRIESRKPAGSIKARVKYLRSELQKLDWFFHNNLHFIQYCRSGSNYMDASYFVREKQDIQLDIDIHHFDPLFSTGYDLLLSEMVCNEQMCKELNDALLREKVRVECAGNVNSAANVASPVVQTAFKGAELYAFLRSIIDAGIVVNHTYKSFFELTVPGIANKQLRAFTPASLLKYSDKMDLETRENVKRLLQKMIRNIDSY